MIVVYGRWMVLGIVGLMTVVTFIGFTTQVYDWIMVLFIAALASIEIRKFMKDRQMFRLSIVIPLMIEIIFASPLRNMLPSAVLISLRMLGIAAILIYFFYDYKVRNEH